MYGLIGKKLGHSYSKIIHEKISQIEYQLVELDEIDTLMKSKSFKAINVTIPYKQEVIPYLDVIDERAKRIHAVNCVVNRSGKLYGYNTDYDGFLYMILHHHIQIKDKKVLILGDGGTSNTVYHVVKDLHAQKIIKISRKGPVKFHEIDQYTDFEIVINTTPVGMYPNNDACLIDIKKFKRCEAVLDVIYNPVHTLLVQQAQEIGIPAFSGLEMLVAQAVYASELFLDKHYPDGLIDAVYREIYRDIINVVLIVEKDHCSFVDKPCMIGHKKWINLNQMMHSKPNFIHQLNERQLIYEFGIEHSQMIICNRNVLWHYQNIVHLRYNGILIDEKKYKNERGKINVKNFGD